MGAVRWRAVECVTLGVGLLGSGVAYRLTLPPERTWYSSERFNALFVEEGGRLVPVPDLAHLVGTPRWNAQEAIFGDSAPPGEVVYWVQVLVNGSKLRARPFYDVIWRQESGVMVIRVTDTRPDEELADSQSPPVATLVDSVWVGPTQQVTTRFKFESLRGCDLSPYIAALAEAFEANTGTDSRFVANERDDEPLPLAQGDSGRLLDAASRRDQGVLDVRWRGVVQNWFAPAVMIGATLVIFGFSRLALAWGVVGHGRKRCARCLCDVGADHAEPCPECGQRITWPEGAS